MGTLRAWERRYGFPKPDRRRDSNRRRYSNEQLERLRLVARLLERGYRPSDVIHAPEHELARLLNNSLGASQQAADASAIGDVHTLLKLLSADDAKGIEQQLRLAAAAWGAKRFVTDLAQPLAEAVGQAWAQGQLEVRHEHLMTECLTTELRAMLAAHQDADGAPQIVLATLPGETHTLGLQMVAVYLALSAAKPRLLGASTPPEQLVSAAKALGASIIGVAISPAAERAATRRQLRRIARLLPEPMTLWVGGGGASTLGALPLDARAITSWSEIDAALANARRSI
jgi:DNA-binding transcriptional MerR regulator